MIKTRSQMKLHAICENHLYSKAYAKGKKCVCRNVVVYILNDLKASKLKRENPMKEKINRVGITVTKKLGGAVVRNRAKRIVREGYRASVNKHPVKKGYLIVIVVRGQALKAKSCDIERDLDMAFEKLNMTLT